MGTHFGRSRDNSTRGQRAMNGAAVVLGAGGVSGRAWEIGVLAGLAREGTDLSEADTFVGTSAGSLVASCLASGQDLQALYERHLQLELPTEATMNAPSLLLRVAWLFIRHFGDREAFRVTSGALASRLPPAVTPEQLTGLARLLRVNEWPDRRLMLATVDADTGQAVALTQAAGVDLVHAVAASSTLPGARPPVAAAGRRLIDGGFRSVANADLASGCDPIVIISPTLVGGGPIHSSRRQAAQLRQQATVVTVTPDTRSRLAMGVNPMNDSNRPKAARAGYRQGTRMAAEVARSLAR